MRQEALCRNPDELGASGSKSCSPQELVLIDDFRFQHRMPSRAAAVREILTRGLSALGFAVPTKGLHSGEFGVTSDRGLEKDD